MPLLEAALLAQFVVQARLGRAARASLASEMAQLHEEQLAGDAKKQARTKWLHANAAEASFPCGVVDVEGTAVPVLVAIVPEGIAFLAESPRGWSVDDVLEVARIPGSAITYVDVVDRAGAHVAEPLRETFEDDVDVWIVLRSTRDGEANEDRFGFRSAWMAWRAVRRLREAGRG